MISKLVSGGQAGVDRAALQVARELGIPTGGWAPRGWRTDTGSDPTLAEYDLQEHVLGAYPARTWANVRDSDGTLIFGWEFSPGCRLTRQACEALRRPFLTVAWPAGALPSQSYVEEWIMRNRIQTLNVAGNRERKNPGVSAACQDFLRRVLK